MPTTHAITNKGANTANGGAEPSTFALADTIAEPSTFTLAHTTAEPSTFELTDTTAEPSTFALASGGTIAAKLVTVIAS